MVERIAVRLALAIDNGSLYAAEQAARTAAERAAERATRLQAVTAALSRAVTPEQVATAILDQIRQALGARSSQMRVLVADGATLRLVSTSGPLPQPLAHQIDLPTNVETPLVQAVHTDTAVLIESVEELRRRFPALSDFDPNALVNQRALAALPLSIDGRRLGGLILAFAESRRFAPDDVALMRSLAQLGAQALERARLYAAEHEARAAAEAAQRQVSFLSEASATLATSLDPEEALRAIGRLATPAIADICAVHLPQDDGLLRRVVLATADGALTNEEQEALTRFPIEMDSLHPSALVMRNGEPILASEVTDDLMERGSGRGERLRLLRQIGVVSLINAPLIAHGRTIGVLVLMTSVSGRRYGLEDLAIAQELARRAAVAVNNAHLYAAEQAARTAADHAAGRATRLQAITAALSAALTPDEVARVVLGQCVEALGARTVWISQLSPDGDVLEALASTGLTDDQITALGRIALDDNAVAGVACATGEPQVFGSREELFTRFPHLPPQLRPRRNHAFAALPLLVKGQPFGVLYVAFPEPRRFHADDRAFLAALTHQCAQALDRARLYAAEQAAREEAEAAQRRLSFLAEASAMLSATLDVQRALDTIARLIVPAHADSCTVNLVDDGGALRRVAAIAFRDGVVRDARAAIEQCLGRCAAPPARRPPPSRPGGRCALWT
ncbi:MAG: GAF domain-containing protein [Dehalococcoidia bacterium]